jgi:hypothetical protein
MCVSGLYRGHKSVKSRLISSACDNPIKDPQPIVGKFASVAASPSLASAGGDVCDWLFFRISESAGYG